MKPPFAPEDMIVEGIVTTLPSPQGTGHANIAPMGPIVNHAMTRFIFRPFKSSTTYQNVKATGVGVFHVTDDAAFLARAAIGHVVPGPDVPTRPAEKIRGLVLTGACRCFELRVTELDDRNDRTTIHAEVVHTRTLRDFLGFNRARHALVEAAILATRVNLTGVDPVLEEFKRLQNIIDKTGSDEEHRAMDELRRHVEESRLK